MRKHIIHEIGKFDEFCGFDEFVVVLARTVNDVYDFFLLLLLFSIFGLVCLLEFCFGIVGFFLGFLFRFLELFALLFFLFDRHFFESFLLSDFFELCGLLGRFGNRFENLLLLRFDFLD